MKFSEWVAGKVAAEKTTTHSVLETASAATGISMTTLKSAQKGGRITAYPIAKRLSDYTAGEVSVTDLCEG